MNGNLDICEHATVKSMYLRYAAKKFPLWDKPLWVGCSLNHKIDWFKWYTSMDKTIPVFFLSPPHYPNLIHPITWCSPWITRLLLCSAFSLSQAIWATPRCTISSPCFPFSNPAARNPPLLRQSLWNWGRIKEGGRRRCLQPWNLPSVSSLDPIFHHRCASPTLSIPPLGSWNCLVNARVNSSSLLKLLPPHLLAAPPFAVNL